MEAPDRFYGDPVDRFSAMAEASNGPIDESHFRMWCGIAARELMYHRYLVDMGAEKLVQFMELCAAAEVALAEAVHDSGDWDDLDFEKFLERHKDAIYHATGVKR